MTRAPWLEALRSSRLLHFAILGGLLFAFSRKADDDAIRIDRRSLSLLETEEARRLGVAALSTDQAREVEARAVSDAIHVREARRLGLDKDDRLVQQRLAQKVLFLAEDMGGASQEPTEAELRAFFEGARSQYVHPERFRFVHVVAKSEAEAAALVPAVEAWDASAHPENAAPPLGDSLPVSRFVDARPDELSVVYGDAFVTGLRSGRVGAWSTPLRSKLGAFHLVKVLVHEQAREATFEEVKASLPLDVLVAKREAAVARYLGLALKRYRVEIDGARLTTLPSIKRTAVHAQASLED